VKKPPVERVGSEERVQEEKMLGAFPIDVVLLAPDLDASKEFFAKKIASR
jgi:hypothetical protein